MLQENFLAKLNNLNLGTVNVLRVFEFETLRLLLKNQKLLMSYILYYPDLLSRILRSDTRNASVINALYIQKMNSG